MQTLFPNRLSAQVQQREAIRKQCSIPLKPLRMNSGCALTEHISDSRLLLCSWGTDSALHNLRLLWGTSSALHNLAHSRHTLVECLPNLWQVRCGIHSASHYLMQGGDTFAKGFLNLWQVRCRTNHIVHNLMYSRYTLVERLPNL